jgi:hypothetical protein
VGEKVVLVAVRAAEEGRDPEGVGVTLVYAIGLRGREVIWDREGVLEMYELVRTDLTFPAGCRGEREEPTNPAQVAQLESGK